jgi:protein O-mannosyl-transferase
LLSILSYLRWLGSTSRKTYVLALVSFVCALLSKGTTVTLPALLLVLNVYPLRRLGGAAGWWSDTSKRVYRELVPFVTLSFVASAMTLVALQRLDQLGTADKVVVSAYSLAFYLWKTIAPVNLSPLYQMPANIDRSQLQFILGAAAVIVLCILAWIYRKRRPAIAAAWVAFALAVFPLLGIVQNGPQIAADRYTYFAAPSAAMLAAFALMRFTRPVIAIGVATLALVSLGVLTWKQSRVWRDSETLWSQVLRVEPNSAIGRNNFGNVVAARGEWIEAIEQYERAVELSPRYAEAHNNLGVALARVGRTREAVEHYRRALAINPSYAEAQNNWGIATIQQGDAVEAMEHYRRALAINPANADAHTNLGNALVRVGRSDEAIHHYAEAVAVRPDLADAHLNWGVALARQGKLNEAIERFRRTLAIDPNHPEAKEYFGRALEMQRRADSLRRR